MYDVGLIISEHHLPASPGEEQPWYLSIMVVVSEILLGFPSAPRDTNNIGSSIEKYM
jgi:hypothetical protein